MGYNSTVLILNDYLSDIEKDPEFGKKLAAAIREMGSKPVPVRAGTSHVGAVVNSLGSDWTTLIAVGGNHASVLYSKGTPKHHTREAQWDLLEEALDYLSRLSKPPTDSGS